VKAGGRPRRFVLVDPCLTGPGAHPFRYAEIMLGAAIRAGCEGLLVTHREFAGSRPDWRVMPVFTHTAYSKYTLAGGLDRLDAHGRRSAVPEFPWRTWRAAGRREERVATFAREIAPAIADLQAGDVLLVATASELEAAGLARAIAAVAPPPGIGWHVQYHLPVFKGFASDFAPQERRFAAARTLLDAAAARAAPHVIHHHAVTEELASQYARLIRGPVGTLAYPVLVPERSGRSAAGPLRIACLGDIRPEKCSAQVLDAVAAMRADPWLAARARFAVQTNPGYPSSSRRPEHRAVTRALAALTRAAAGDAAVELLGGPLDLVAFERELAAADVMLLAYDPSRYRSRCSSVELEALAGGSVPVVTGGGWMARQFAAAVADHAAGLARRSPTLAQRRLDRPRITDRPLAIELAAPTAGDRAVVVELSWDAAEADALHLPPVRVAVAGAASRPATVLAPHAATTVFPLPATTHAPARMEFTAAGGATVAEPAAITIRELAVEHPVPASAVGLVIDGPHDLPAAVREVVRHAAHYRATAAAHGSVTRGRTSAAEVVRRLLS